MIPLFAKEYNDSLLKSNFTCLKTSEGLVIADGLEVQAMATEPMLKNPTNIDVTKEAAYG